jgi:hypothetical protein
MYAQQPASDVPATKEDVEKLFNTMHIREQMRNVMDVMLNQSKQMSHDALKKKLPDTSQKDLDRLDALTDQMLKNFDIGSLIDDMIPVYQRHLSKADVAAMSAFYETPTGQKLLREQPQMTAEAMQAVQPEMEKMMSSLMDQAEKMAKEAAGESKPSIPVKN